MTNSIDTKIMEMLSLVQQKKADLDQTKKLINSGWKTNCSISLHPDKTSPKNIAVLKKQEIIEVLAFILQTENYIVLAEQELGISAKITKTHPKIQGYTVSDWKADCKKRIASLDLKEKEAELDTLETRVNAIVSPEIRRQMEITALEKELSKL